jgi:DNA-binding transcriptional regulator YiaG
MLRNPTDLAAALHQFSDAALAVAVALEATEVVEAPEPEPEPEPYANIYSEEDESGDRSFTDGSELSPTRILRRAQAQKSAKVQGFNLGFWSRHITHVRELLYHMNVQEFAAVIEVHYETLRNWEVGINFPTKSNRLRMERLALLHHDVSVESWRG